MAAINLRNCTIKFKDGTTPTANSISVKVGTGNLTYTEKRNLEYRVDRGIIDDVVLGDDVPMDVKLDFVWEFITAVTSSGVPTIEDVLKKQGEAAAWVTTDSDTCRPYCVNIEVTNIPTNCPATDEEIILLPYFRWDQLDHNLKDSQVSITGRCNATSATATRQAQS